MLCLRISSCSHLSGLCPGTSSSTAGKCSRDEATMMDGSCQQILMQGNCNADEEVLLNPETSQVLIIYLYLPCYSLVCIHFQEYILSSEGLILFINKYLCCSNDAADVVIFVCINSIPQRNRATALRSCVLPTEYSSSAHRCVTTRWRWTFAPVSYQMPK